MSNVLHLPGRPEAPIACDMSTADDTPDERVAEWRELFERALLSRERRADSVVFSFRAEPGRREQLEDLARREHACCPFLDYRVDTAGDVVIWTTSNVLTGDERASIDIFLDALHALPDHAASTMDGLLERLSASGLNLVEADDRQFELR